MGQSEASITRDRLVAELVAVASGNDRRASDKIIHGPWKLQPCFAECLDGKTFKLVE